MVFCFGLVFCVLSFKFYLEDKVFYVPYCHKPNLNPKPFALSSVASGTRLIRHLQEDYPLVAY